MDNNVVFVDFKNKPKKKPKRPAFSAIERSTTWMLCLLAVLFILILYVFIF